MRWGLGLFYLFPGAAADAGRLPSSGLHSPVTPVHRGRAAVDCSVAVGNLHQFYKSTSRKG